jgi:hypothetical protein
MTVREKSWSLYAMKWNCTPWGTVCGHSHKQG